MIRRFGERRHGAPHRLMRGAQDIDPVDLLVLHDGHRPVDLGVRVNSANSDSRWASRSFFESSSTLWRNFSGKNHRRRDHRSGERAPARFIDARDPAQPRLTKRTLTLQIAFC